MKALVCILAFTGFSSLMVQMAKHDNQDGAGVAWVIGCLTIGLTVQFWKDRQ